METETESDVAAVITDGVVVNLILVPKDEGQWPDLGTDTIRVVAVEDRPQIGATFDGKKFVNPPELEAEPEATPAPVVIDADKVAAIRRAVAGEPDDSPVAMLAAAILGDSA